MNILIPMAGAGSRFAAKGYKRPKPFIDVGGEPMIQRVVDNLRLLVPDGRLIFCVRSEWVDELLVRFLGSTVVEVPGLTEGAACTALLAKRFINDEEPLLIANSDQLVRANRNNFDEMRRNGGHFPLCFKPGDASAKWSYIDEQGHVAEKRPISDTATCGVYYWDSGAAFVAAAERMIAAGDRYNGESYIAPCYNYSDDFISRFYVDEMIGLGTPEDLEAYLAAG